jgi:predicted RNA binding protein YcfA (HicA-like mRNA interferase family)
MSKKVTFGDIHRLLEAYGFEQTSIKGKHVLFEHKASDTLLMFRPHRRNELVDAMTLSIVQKTLDARGFLESDEFEDALRQVSVDGKAKIKPE